MINRPNLGHGLWRRQWHPTPVLLPGKSHGRRRMVGCSPWGHEESDTTEWLHFDFHVLEKEMATHSSVLAWRIPGTGEPGGLSSMGSHRVGHDWSDLAAAAGCGIRARNNLESCKRHLIPSKMIEKSISGIIQGYNISERSPCIGWTFRISLKI